MADGAPAHDDHGQALAVATRLHATGDSTGALELLPDLVAARPDDGAVRLLLARCLATAGTAPVALAAADAAVACDPSSWAAQTVLAQAAVAIDPERATTAAERAVQLAPHEPEAHRVLASVQAALTESPTSDDGPRRRTAGALGATLGRRPTAPGGAATALDEPRLSPRLPAALAGVVPEGVAPEGPASAPPTADADGPAPGTLAEPPPSPTAMPAAPGAPVAPSPDPVAATPATPAETPVWAAPPAPPVTATAASPAPVPDPGPLATATPAAPPTTLPVPPTTDAQGALGAPPRREPLLPKALGGTGLAGTTLVGDTPEEDRIGGAHLAVRVIGLVTWLLVGFRVGVQVIGGPVGIAVFVAVLAWVAFLGRRLNQR